MKNKTPEDSDFFLSPVPSREPIELVVARAKAKAAKREEARQAAQQQINRPQPSGTGYVRPPDDFERAAERMAQREAIIAQDEADIVEGERTLQRKLQHLRSKRRAYETIRRVDAMLKRDGFKR